MSEDKAGIMADYDATLAMYQVARNEILTKQQTQQTVLSWTVALFVAGVAAVLLVNSEVDVTENIVLGEWLVLVSVALVGLVQYVGELASILRAAAYAYQLEKHLAKMRILPVAPWEHWLKTTGSWIAIPAWTSATMALVLALLAQAVPFVVAEASVRPEHSLLLWIGGGVVTCVVPAALGFFASFRCRKLERVSARNSVDCHTSVSGRQDSA